MPPPAKKIYEGKSFLVIDKKAGKVTLSSGRKKEGSLGEWLRDEVFPRGYFSSFKGEFSRRAGLVHRLDKDTSGLLLVAKTPAAFSFLQEQFRKRKVKKEYLLLLHGDLPQEGSIVAPIKRFSRRKRKFAVLPGGREAKTDYRVIERFSLQKKGERESFSLVRAFPQTGRTHQIRVHFHYLGFPLWGDQIYGWKREEEGRLFLHAEKISFFNPDFPQEKKMVSFQSPIPQELKEVITKLKRRGESG